MRERDVMSHRPRLLLGLHQGLQVLVRIDWPDFDDVSGCAQRLGVLRGADSQPDMAYVLCGSEVLVGNRQPRRVMLHS